MPNAEDTIAAFVNEMNGFRAQQVDRRSLIFNEQNYVISCMHPGQSACLSFIVPRGRDLDAQQSRVGSQAECHPPCRCVVVRIQDRLQQAVIMQISQGFGDWSIFL